MKHITLFLFLFSLAGGSISATLLHSVPCSKYLANQIEHQHRILNGQEFTENDLYRLRQGCEDLLVRMQTISGIKSKELVWRAVPKTVKTSNGIGINTEATTFDFHKGTSKANARYSPPGLPALYTALISDGDIWNRLKIEVNHDGNRAYVISCREFEFTNIIDLRDEKTRMLLGIMDLNSLRLNTKVSTFAYEKTHQLGFLARELLFEGIVVPSAPTEDWNIVIFVRPFTSAERCPVSA